MAIATVLAMVWGAFALVGSRTPARDITSLRRAPVAALVDANAWKQPIDAHGEFLCPPDAPFAAHRSGVYYPPNHPLRPPLDTRPERCYPIREQADLDGYRLAPIPPPYRETGMVYLGPPVRAVAQDCRRAAVRLGFAVPCPTLLPLPAFGVPDFRCPRRGALPDGCVVSEAFSVPSPAFVFEATNFAVPPTWFVGQTPDLLIVARPIGGAAGRLACVPQGGSSSTSIALQTAGVHDRPAVFLRCRNQEPPGGLDAAPYAGRYVLQWRERGLLCEVSMTGVDADLVRALEWWIATQTRWVGPAGPVKP